MSTHSYPGSELELFQHAVNWKAYYARKLRPFVAGDVLEVGAGIGGTTAHLCTGRERSWTCLEPDPSLLDAARRRLGDSLNGVPLRFQRGLLRDLPEPARFDTILYIDVLEHIEDDASELQQAIERLMGRGHIVVLSPAHEWLYSEFDKAIGHWRRYTIDALGRLTPPGATLVWVRYLDCLGALLSLGNRLLLRQERPTAGQIAFWDSRVLPVSKLADPALGRIAGRSVVAVWRRVGA